MCSAPTELNGQKGHIFLKGTVQANWAIHYDQMEVKGLDNNKLKYNSYMQQNIFLK